jgi:hypothetical protein
MRDLTLNKRSALALARAILRAIYGPPNDCPHCWGEGVIDSGEPGEDEVACWTCGGNGKLFTLETT